MVVHVMQSIPSVFHVYQCRESSWQRQDCGKDTSCFFWRNMKKSGSLCKTVTNVSGWTQSLLKAMQSCTQFLSQPKSGIKWVNCYFDCCMYISSYIHKYVDFISLYMQVGIDMIGPLPLIKRTGILLLLWTTSPSGQEQLPFLTRQGRAAAVDRDWTPCHISLPPTEQWAHREI